MRTSNDRDDRMGALDQNPKKTFRDSNKKNSLDQNLTPQKTHAKFRSHNNFLEAETVAKQVWFNTLFPEEPKQLLRSSLSVEIHSNASPTTHPSTPPPPSPLRAPKSQKRRERARRNDINVIKLFK